MATYGGHSMSVQIPNNAFTLLMMVVLVTSSLTIGVFMAYAAVVGGLA